MWLSRTAPLPVRGIPLLLFGTSLFGITVGTYLYRVISIPWETVFVFLLVFSQGFGVEIQEDQLVLLYGFGVLKQRLALDSIDELSLLSRLERGAILKHFKAYTFTWLVIALWLLFDFFVLKGAGNLIRLYMDVFIILTFTLFFLSLSIPRNKKGILWWIVLASSIFMFVYPYHTWGSKALFPAFIFLLLAIFIVRGFQNSDFILVTVGGKSYLLSSEKPELALKQIREAMRNA